MRIVIADDEPLVRSFVRSLVAEAARRDDVILEAADGLELVRMVESGEADAAIVDIRMPKMDGFAALEWVRSGGHKVPWFVLSSHSDFVYAKRALELGALGYALKPPSPEDIRDAVGKLRAAMEADREARLAAFEHDWAMFLMGNAQKAPDLGPGARYSAALIVLDGAVGAAGCGREAEAAVRAVRDRGRRFAERGVFAAAALWGGELRIAAIAGIGGLKMERSAENALKAFWNEAARAAEAAEAGLSDRAARVLVLFSDAGEDASRCGNLLQSLRSLALCRALLPSGAVDSGEAESILSSASPADREIAAAADSLSRCLRSGDAAGLRSAIRSFLALPGGGAAVRFLERYLGDAVRTRSEAELTAECERLIGESSPPATERDTISQVEEYLRRHFAERLSVEGAADLFGLTANYLSSLFHKRTGSTFVRYLTEIRLSRARELLREGRSVKETAWAVGYGNERHFTRLYRERFGHAPAVEKKTAAQRRLPK